MLLRWGLHGLGLTLAALGVLQAPHLLRYHSAMATPLQLLWLAGPAPEPVGPAMVMEPTTAEPAVVLGPAVGLWCSRPAKS